MTLSPPVRVAAFVAALVLTGLGAFVFLLGSKTPTEPATLAPPATKPAAPASTPAKAHRQKPAAARTSAVASSLPAPVAAAFRHRKVVVVAVYVPGASVDAVVRSEARAGARMAGAAFVAISSASENALQKLVAKTGVLPAPAVVILKRPGVVTMTFGVADRQTVAAAVAQTKTRR
jgi:hypothetical protein